MPSKFIAAYIYEHVDKRGLHTFKVLGACHGIVDCTFIDWKVVSMKLANRWQEYCKPSDVPCYDSKKLVLRRTVKHVDDMTHIDMYLVYDETKNQ